MDAEILYALWEGKGDMTTKYNTRFNPTVNGCLHLGHLYLALVNEYEAHASGGRFIVRFDDNQEVWVKKFKGQMAEMEKQVMDDLCAFIVVDEFTYQGETDRAVYKQLDYLVHVGKLQIPPPSSYVSEGTATKQFNGDVKPVYLDLPDWRPDTTMQMYPYAPYLTAERVYLDFHEGVNWLIRGIDMVCEFALYQYYAQLLGYPAIKQTFLPRLRAQYGEQLAPVSKTLGGHTIKDAVEKHGAEWVMQLLRESCLVDPSQPFSVKNIKSDPRLVRSI